MASWCVFAKTIATGWPKYEKKSSARIGSPFLIGPISFSPGMSFAVIIFVKNGRSFSLSELIFFIFPHATFDRTGAPCNKFSCSGISSI